MSLGRDSGEWYVAKPRRPGPSTPRPAGRAQFGKSWWGAAWVESLEQRARLDPNRLPRGRSYARSGAVGPLTLAPGEILAEVQGSRRTPYTVRVRVRPFTADEWDRVLDGLAAEIGHTAALLDGELPPGVAEDIRSIGLDLLPGVGELQPRCSCPDWADPCKHAAAVCYLVADLLDSDPFGVLLLRGLGREEILSGLRSRRFQGTPAGASALEIEPEVDAGVPAQGAFSRALGPLPTLPAPAHRPGRPSVLAADPPPGSGVDPRALRALAADAAARAFALTRGSSSHGLELTLDEDLARRAALLLDGQGSSESASELPKFAKRAGIQVRELVRRAAAFRAGGVGGLAALEEVWDPTPDQIESGASVLGRGAVARRNRVTLGERQIRLGRDHLWYPFRRVQAGRWEPDGAPISPTASLGDLGELDEERGPG